MIDGGEWVSCVKAAKLFLYAMLIAVCGCSRSVMRDVCEWWTILQFFGARMYMGDD